MAMTYFITRCPNNLGVVNNRLRKFKTSVELPIILEESMLSQINKEKSESHKHVTSQTLRHEDLD